MLASLLLPLLVLAAPSARDSERINVEDHEAAPPILRALRTKRLSVRFDEAPLADVVRFLATATGINAMLAPALQDRKDELPKISLRLVGVTAANALRTVLEVTDLGAVVRHGVLMITTREDARGKPVLRLYYIADLTQRLRDFPGPELGLPTANREAAPPADTASREVFSDPEALKELVTKSTGAETWQQPGISIAATTRVLIVRQYAEVHREIARLLGELR